MYHGHGTDHITKRVEIRLAGYIPSGSIVV